MKSHSKPIFHIFTLFALLASLLGSALTVTPVYAAGITVNTTVDENNTGADCSLREAITAANTDAAYGGCTAGSGADTITVPAGTYTLSIASTNEDTNVNGDLDIINSVTINGAGPNASDTIIQAGAIGFPGVPNGIDRVFDIVGAGITVSISDVTIANGNCAGCSGGGIYFNTGTLSVTNSTFSGNSAVDGGGIVNNAGTLTVTNSTFSNNSTTLDGGGIYNNGILTVTNSAFSGNSAASSSGGGIYNYSDGTLNVTNSTFSGNSATYGGGIYNWEILTVTNSTFSGNSAFYGGGINTVGSLLTVMNSTFSNNSANPTNGGGIRSTGTTTLYNTIVANSTNGGDCSGILTADSFINLDTDGTCDSATQKTSLDINLGALANNGGPTQTRALGSGSDAIDAGDGAVCAVAAGSPTYGPGGLDQRGVPRPLASCDIGAFESNAQSASPFVVNTTEDSNDGSCDAFAAGVTDCSLREAITAANTLAGADTITLPADTYTLALPGAGEEANATGDLDITGSLTINGASAGSTIIQAHVTPGSGIDRVFQVIGAIPVNITNVTIANGKCSTSFCDGGGIHNAGTLTVSNSTFSNNSAEGGGGIINYGTLTVTNSTFSANSALYGGGIYTAGIALTVTNSTFSANSAFYGGGINNISSTLTVTNNTFSNNSATNNGGGINNGGTLHLKNTLLANNASGADCYNSGGTIASDTNNLIKTNGAGVNACGTPLVTTDPGLGALADNGGATQTFAITNTSSAYNAGDNATCAATDQRGVTRPQGTRCDIGSFELFVYTLFLPLILR